MGLLEFLLWCEDLNVEPVLAVFAGYALSGEHVTPGPGSSRTCRTRSTRSNT